MIPKRLIRTVPAVTPTHVEQWWQQACDMHSDWEHVTLRDPIDRTQFPITSPYWDTCESGAQLADLVRAEELFWRGGVYIDSDYECLAPFTALLGLSGFAAWEDNERIPNAVMGFEPAHPALQEVLQLAIQRHNQGTWHAGVGVTTEVFKGRTDMLVLPPPAFYPIHWRVKRRPDRNNAALQSMHPWAFGVHHWAHSWATA